MAKLMLLLVLICSAFLQAQDHVKTKVIDYNQGGVELRGFFAWNDSLQQPLPGILVVHEWWGLNDYARMRTRRLAEMGYAAFALDMYGNGQVAENAEQAGKLAGQFYQDRQLMRDRAAAGLQVLKSQPPVDKNKLAAIGFCFGGSTALELARSGADLDAVVSFHGGLSTPNPADAKNIKGQVLVLHGGEDPHVKPEEVMDFWNEMQNAGVQWQLNVYGGAVHSFSNPASGSDKSSGVAYNETAAKRAWRDMKLFFNEIWNIEPEPQIH
ncbi:MAG: dienelactone hydrolase family protein [Calditrichia bacterium]